MPHLVFTGGKTARSQDRRCPKGPGPSLSLILTCLQASWGLALELRALAQLPLDTRTEGPLGQKGGHSIPRGSTGWAGSGGEKRDEGWESGSWEPRPASQWLPNLGSP